MNNNHSLLEILSWIAGIAVALLAFHQWYAQKDKTQGFPAPAATEAPPQQIQQTPKLKETLPVVSPSFDCTKARWKSERLVCSSPRLAVLDLAMSNAYHDAVARMPTRKIDLRDSQNHWLRKVRELCDDIGCLEVVYQRRISELERE